MTYYARIDHKAKGPTQVLGYYDTDFDPYVNIDFNQPEFFQLTQKQWDERQGDSHHHNGKLIPKPPESKEEIAQREKDFKIYKAKKLLAGSNDAIMKFYEEDKPVSKEWKEYRSNLRKIIAGEDINLPETPN